MSTGYRYYVKLQFILLVVFGFSFSLCAQATPNVVGKYSGVLNGTQTIPIGGTPFSDTVDITIDQQSGTVISGKITFSTAGLATTFSGNIIATNIIDVVFDASATVAASGGFAGTFTGSSLIIPSGTGSLVIFGTTPTNTYDVGGTLTFSNSGIIDSATASSTALKSAGTIRTEINSISSPIHSHLQKTMRGEAKGIKPDETGFLIEGEGGLNAGDMQFGNVGAWLSYNYTETENDFLRTAFESDSHFAVGGVDFSFSDSYVFGVAFGYESSDTDTTFNQGNLETDGVTLIPYLGILLSDNWSLDASLGFSWLENDQFRIAPGTTTRITSAPDSGRLFYTANINGVTFIDNWVIGGRMGILFAKSETDNFTESDGTTVAERETTLGQLRIGGDVAYNFGVFEPFVNLLYERDYIFDEIVLTTGLQPANDRDDVLFSSGFRYFGDQGLTGNFEYSKRLLRNDFEDNSYNLTLRYDW